MQRKSEGLYGNRSNLNTVDFSSVLQPKEFQFDEEGQNSKDWDLVSLKI